MLKSVLYVSDVAAPDHMLKHEISRIVEHSQVYNATHGITGALVCTGTHFVQWLEGEQDIIDRLLERISMDTRHCNLRVIQERTLRERSFHRWGLAYSGNSIFIEKFVSAVLEVLDPVDDKIEVYRLQELLVKLADGGLGGSQIPLS